MLQRFIAHVIQQHLFPTGQEVLLAVSGGIDSVVLAHLMHSAGFPYAIAHCNFHLRPDDCDRDEAFVRALARDYGVAIHVAQFQTGEYARQHGLGTEDAARRLRYDWFARLCGEHGYPALLTAHHRDDSNETFFLNLLRGTGLTGLHGILPVNGIVVRPLLPFSRAEIEEYALSQGLSHVEDFTNASLLYRRNQVRHRLLPLLRELQPTADSSVARTVDNLQSVERLYMAMLQPIRQQMLTVLPDGTLRLSLDFSSVLPGDRSGTVGTQLLFELLRPYGFNAAAAASILAADTPGRTFRSSSHMAVLDRGFLLISPLQGKAQEPLPGLQIQPLSAAQSFPNPRALPPDQMLLDADTVVLPLSLRHWREGDRFQPLGMPGCSQLLSDYFSDHKYSLLDKQRQLLLVDADDRILWIVGHRTSHHCRVTPDSQRLLLVTIAP